MWALGLAYCGGRIDLFAGTLPGTSPQPLFRLANRFGQFAQKLRGFGSVRDAMVARERHRHHPPDARFAIDRNDAVGNAPYRENRSLWRGDDGAESVHPLHAAVADAQNSPPDVPRAARA